MHLRSVASLSLLLGVVSCSSDTRSVDLRIAEALSDRPEQYDIRGTSAGVIFDDGTITIRQLLGHTSGIFMFWENQKIWDDPIKYHDSVFSPEAVLTYVKKPHFPPGKGFRHSNTNYLLPARIITKATDSSLSAQLRTRFWQPLGLTNTYPSLEEHLPRGRLAHARLFG